MTQSRLSVWPCPRVGQVLIGSFNRGTSGCGIAAANEFEACEFLLLAKDICDQARRRLPGRARSAGRQELRAPSQKDVW